MMQQKRGTQGYTLIEILVVLFIISIVTSVALLTISRNNNKEIETIANDLRQRVTFAEEQALLQPNVLGLSVGDHSYQFASFQQALDDKKKNSWQPITDNLLGKYKIPSNIEIAIEINHVSTPASHAADDITKSIPQIIISSNGEITPFTIYVGRKGEKPRYAIKGDANGNVSSQALS